MSLNFEEFKGSGAKSEIDLFVLNY